ncbi:hypothetical protein H9X96_13595 [Pedobacter sp. N36a]|uniref:AcvB/VirJ family lysyl-phosphatidylglycerol hydrolase n=1 Tax=Pedobacter sp. N36a TaxID=2767996 RepID=UPI001656C27F|nr:AcvB/VirJ family lysyl-phosphatidylglycerol hydrolase [Pedobacter sp. N36a]MBC8986809.1 hypothetical protein [Pedobacter sp. N36a]
MYKFTFVLVFILMSVSMKALEQKSILEGAAIPTPKISAKRIIFFFSGDGGMTNSSRSLANELIEDYAVVCIDSRKYFWNQKTLAGMTLDFTQLIRHYLKSWNKTEFSIVGYSFGADVSIFLTPRLPADLQQQLKSVILLSPSTSTDFKIKLTDMIGFMGNGGKYKTIPEISKINFPALLILSEKKGQFFFDTAREKENIKLLRIGNARSDDYETKKVILEMLNAF